MKVIGFFTILIFSCFFCQGQDYINTLNDGIRLYKEKSYEPAKAKILTAKKEAVADSNTTLVEKANGILSKIQYNMATMEYKKGNYDGAIAMHQEGFGYDATNAMNLYGEGRTLAKKGDPEAAMLILDKAINSGSEKVAKAAKKTLKNIYYKKTNKIIKAKDTDKESIKIALDLLDKADSYGLIDEKGHYFYALAYNISENYGEAVAHSDKAIEMNAKTDVEKAKYYYTKGKALMAQENNQEAKAAFEMAKHGAYADNAQIYIDRL